MKQVVAGNVYAYGQSGVGRVPVRMQPAVPVERRRETLGERGRVFEGFAGKMARVNGNMRVFFHAIPT